MKPMNYNIPYYQADDFTIVIYPKDSDGNAFDFATGDSAYFRIADKRGPDPGVHVAASASLQPPNMTTEGVWAIKGDVASVDGERIDNGFVYDIGYMKDGKRVTVLTGTFSVVQQVEGMQI